MKVNIFYCDFCGEKVDEQLVEQMRISRPYSIERSMNDQIVTHDICPVCTDRLLRMVKEHAFAKAADRDIIKRLEEGNNADCNAKEAK